MNAGTLAEIPSPTSVPSRQLHAVEEAPQTTSPTESAELHRWLTFLTVPFVLSAVFFAASIGTGTEWLMAPALLFGPMLIIFSLIYLGLSSDSNAPA